MNLVRNSKLDAKIDSASASLIMGTNHLNMWAFPNHGPLFSKTFFFWRCPDFFFWYINDETEEQISPHFLIFLYFLFFQIWADHWECEEPQHADVRSGEEHPWKRPAAGIPVRQSRAEQSRGYHPLRVWTFFPPLLLLFAKFCNSLLSPFMWAANLGQKNMKPLVHQWCIPFPSISHQGLLPSLASLPAALIRPCPTLSSFFANPGKKRKKKYVRRICECWWRWQKKNCPFSLSILSSGRCMHWWRFFFCSSLGCDLSYLFTFTSCGDWPYYWCIFI